MEQANMVNIVNILWTKSIIQYRRWKTEGGEGEVYMLFSGGQRGQQGQQPRLL